MASSAVPIPKRKQPIRPHHQTHRHFADGSPSGTPMMMAESLGSSLSSSVDHSSSSSAAASSLSKTPDTFGRAVSFQTNRSPGESISPRRPSLLSSSLSRSEHTVVNLGHGNGPPRLVTCVKSSQGFDWNQELFLPSYAAYETHDLEHKPDPVFDIILTDEEAAAIFPQ